jgi:drug/metabolite transporter (DMT)-like permease
MTSPFATFKDFSDAKGPIYTFANNPTIIGLLLLICLGMTVYFIYASFGLRQGEEKPKSPIALSLLLVAGAASLLGSLFHAQPTRQPEATHRSQYALQRELKGWQPLTMLGLTGFGSSLLGLKSKGRSFRRKRARRSTNQ